MDSLFWLAIKAGTVMTPTNGGATKQTNILDFGVRIRDACKVRVPVGL
jgi:hypothetical protein